MPIPRVGDADLTVGADRDLSTRATEAALVPPGHHAATAYLDEEATGIAQLIELLLRHCVVDADPGKGAVAGFHGCLAPVLGHPPNWREFAVCSETSQKQTPLNFTKKTRAYGASCDAVEWLYMWSIIT